MVSYEVLIGEGSLDLEAWFQAMQLDASSTDSARKDFVDRVEKSFKADSVEWTYRVAWRRRVRDYLLRSESLLLAQLRPLLNGAQFARVASKEGNSFFLWVNGGFDLPASKLDRVQKMHLAKLLYGSYAKFFPGRQTAAVAKILRLSHEEFIQLVREVREETPNPAAGQD